MSNEKGNWKKKENGKRHFCCRSKSGSRGQNNDIDGRGTMGFCGKDQNARLDRKKEKCIRILVILQTQAIKAWIWTIKLTNKR